MKPWLFSNSESNNTPIRSRRICLLGAVLESEGNAAAAAEEYKKVIEMQPEGNRAYVALAGLYRDDPEKRIRRHRGRLRPKYRMTKTLGLLLATEYEKLERYEEAISIYEATLLQNDGNNLAANNLAALMLDVRTDPDSYARALELAIRFEDSQEAALADTLGWAYYRNNQYANAIRHLEIAVDAANEVAILRYHLGMAYLRSDDIVRGKQELEKAIELAKIDFPGIEEARAEAEQIERGISA